LKNLGPGMIPHPWMQFHAHPSTFARWVADLSSPSIFLFKFLQQHRVLWLLLAPDRLRISTAGGLACPQMPADAHPPSWHQPFPVLLPATASDSQRQPERVILGEDAIIDLSMRRTAASLALPGQHPTETSTSTDGSTQVVCGSHNVLK